jgi:hypothetical protein
MPNVKSRLFKEREAPIRAKKLMSLARSRSLTGVAKKYTSLVRRRYQELIKRSGLVCHADRRCDDRWGPLPVVPDCRFFSGGANAILARF